MILLYTIILGLDEIKMLVIASLLLIRDTIVNVYSAGMKVKWWW